MAMQQRARASAAVPAEDASILAVLDEGGMEQVLLAAKAAKVLGLLASSSRQLCNFARSRVPVSLVVLSQERASLIIRSQALGRPSFSGCTYLHISADDSLMCCLTQGILQVAQRWAGLQQLRLCVQLRGQDGRMQDSCTSTLLGGVCTLQQLRRLDLSTSGLGVCCVAQLQQLTQLTCLHLSDTQAPVDAAADLGPLSALTNLVELHLHWALALHLPAGPQGPYSLPSSLVKLHVSSYSHTSPAPMACWLAHLPGCPQLQDLQLVYGHEQHASVHPSALVPLLAQHHPQLRSLDVAYDPDVTTWDAAVAGLPAAAGPVEDHWQPDASLAALKGLQRLISGMCITDQADWQHLAQATALTSLAGMQIDSVPEVQVGSTLKLLELGDCSVALGGYDVGRLLLAWPLLEVVSIVVTPVAAPAPAGARLQPHPALRDLYLSGCRKWGRPSAAAAQFAALAPVLSGVRLLSISDWPLGSSSSEALVMPDLSPCTALTELAFVGNSRQRKRARPLEQESILSMVAPLKQLQRLEVTYAPRINARIALGLQLLLPQLQQLELNDCGYLLPARGGAAGSDGDSSDSEAGDADAKEDQTQQLVLQLLRPGLQVVVS